MIIVAMAKGDAMNQWNEINADIPGDIPADIPKEKLEE